MRDHPGSGQTPTLLKTADCPAYILAGGKGSRFGSDKARVQIGAQPQILRLLEQLNARDHTTYVVADQANRYDDLGLTCLTDEPNHSGPLAGIASALKHRLRSEAGWCLILSCDQVVWCDEWYDALARPSEDQLARTFAIYQQDGRTTPQPIPGLYHTDLLPQLLQHLANGKYSVRALLAAVVSDSQPTASNPSHWSFNTDTELRAIIAKLADHPEITK